MLRAVNLTLIAMFTGLVGACTLPPPDTVPGLAARLSYDRILFNQAEVAMISGIPTFNQKAPTRILGVTLKRVGTRGRNEEMREITFDLKGNCTRVTDFVPWFGKPTFAGIITDGGGSDYGWDIPRPGGNVRVMLGPLQMHTKCAPELWIAQPWEP